MYLQELVLVGYFLFSLYNLDLAGNASIFSVPLCIAPIHY